MALTIKDATYHFGKLKTAVKSRLPKIIFYQWDPLTSWLEATGKRAAECSSDNVQIENDFYIDSAKGARLDRRLGANEGVPRLLAQPATDGTIMLGRQTAPTGTTSFPIGAISASPQPDPNNPGAVRPVYQNTAIVTIGPGATSWTAPFAATTGGIVTNAPAGTVLQLVTQANQLDTAVVATPFTVGTDNETDDAYRQRGKLVIRSRTKGTDDAIIAAALTGGAAFAYTVENASAPPAIVPTLGTSPTGGSLVAGTYLVCLTYQTATGETTRGPEQSITIPAGTAANTLAVSGGALPINVTAINVYATAASGGTGTETKQGGYSGTATGLTLTAIAAGSALPTLNTTYNGFPVNLYAADASGNCSAGLQAAILTQVNGNYATSPPTPPMARAKGILVNVQPAAAITFNFSIGLVVQSYVTGTTLTALQTDIQTAITNYVKALNTPGNTDRTMRINRIKDIVLNFGARGVMDVVDGTFLPASSTALTNQQLAVMGTITWL
jgi:uncharacterized phage protein gp47/JayE